MGKTATDARSSEEPEIPAGTEDSLQVPTQKKRKLKSPTPISLRGRSATPIRGRSQTPFNLYMTRRSATPSTWRSITPYIQREEREKTPFELGRDIKIQTTCNKAVFDRALVMDISEPEEIQRPVRYITSDYSIIDRAAVMDVSNVEVIYVVEEYEYEEGEGEEEEEEEEEIQEVKPKKKEKKSKKSRSKKSESPSADEDMDEDLDDIDSDEPVKKGKKKAASKKKEKKEKSPSPQLTLKLDMGGGPKMNKKMFEQPPAPPKPPLKKTKQAIQAEEQAKAAAAKAAEDAKAKAEKDRQDEQDRLEAEIQAELDAEAELEAELALYGDDNDEDADANENAGQAADGGGDDGGDRNNDGADAAEIKEEIVPEPKKKRRGSDSSEDFTKPDPDEEARWHSIDLDVDDWPTRKYSTAEHRSERDRDADWNKVRHMARLPHFINFLTDRAVQAGKSFRIVCAVDGPEVWAKWYKDGVKIEQTDKHRMSNVSNSLTLEISNTTLEDSGEYKCVLSNMNGEVSSLCKITIYEVMNEIPHPPALSFVREHYNSRDDEMSIEIQFHGVPRPTISWWHSGNQLNNGYKYTVSEEEHGVTKLVIFKPLPRDSGTYVCLAVNPSGDAQYSHKLKVDENLHNLQTPARIYHARNQIQQDRERQARKAMEEALRSKEESDKRRAEAEATSAAASNNEQLQYSTPMRCNKMPDPTPKQTLYFTVGLSNRYVAQGTQARMQAVIGGPNATIRWQKGDAFVAYDQRVRNKSQEGLAILEFTSTEPEDSGMYTVVAYNEYCKINSTAMLHVYEEKGNADVQPVFSRHLRETFVLKNNELILETHVRGIPTPNVTWYKDAVEIETYGRHQVYNHPDGTCQLFIERPCNLDNGRYVVKADNRAGDAQVSHNLVFQGLDSHIADNIHRAFTADKRVILAKIEEQKQYAAEALEDKRIKEKNKQKGGIEAEEEETTDTTPVTSGNKRREKNVNIHLVTFLRDLVVTVGSKVKLSCIIEAKEPLVRWSKNNEILKNVPNVLRARYNEGGICVLDIFTATEEDSGLYQCWARDETGEVATTCKLEVYNPETIIVAPNFTSDVVETLHGKHNELQLTVHIRGLPTPTINWFKDDVRIEPGVKYRQIDHADGTCELFIRKLIPHDSGRYVCKAANSGGNTIIDHEVTLRARTPPKLPPTEEEMLEKAKAKKKKEEEETLYSREVPPPPDLRQRVYFTSYLSNRTVKVGGTVKWVVTIDGPEPVARWFHGDKKIAYGDKSKILMENGMASLKLLDVTEEDAGEYILMVKGPENEIISTCQLNVYSMEGEEKLAPVFTVGIKDTYSLHNNTLMLECRVRGKPRPEIKWIKDHVVIVNNEKYQQIDKADGLSRLIISNPTGKDAGWYACIASNEADECKVTHEVDFAGRDHYTLEKTHGFFHRESNKPSFAAALGNHTVSNGGTIVLTAEFYQTNVPNEVQWYRNGQLLTEEQRNVKLIWDRGVFILTVSKAAAEDEGKYTCRAINDFGYNETSAPVDVSYADITERPPLFTARPDTIMNIKAGEAIVITCKIGGDPKLTLMKGIEDVNSKFSKEVTDEWIKYTMPNAQFLDSATYFVVARNIYGTDRIFVTVEVEDK